MGAELGGGGGGPEPGLFMVRANDDCPGVHQLPRLPRTFDRGRGHQHDMPHTSLDCQRVLISDPVKGNSLLLLILLATALQAQERRPRARDIGIVVGSMPTGALNAITDVAGVRVGHVTIARGDSINTGVTAILPHEGNVFREKVPAAIVVGNGFGKLVGATQLNELGELESPIVLTCTLCVPRAADAVLTYLLGLPGNEDVRSANPVVAETDDGFLSDIRTRPISEGIGSVILVVATDAPLDHRQLERLGRRALAGLARTGSSMSNGSGDYVGAFSTWRTSGQAVGRSTSPTTTPPPDRLTDTLEVVTNDGTSPLLQAAIESSEE